MSNRCDNCLFGDVCTYGDWDCDDYAPITEEAIDMELRRVMTMNRHEWNEMWEEYMDE